MVRCALVHDWLTGMRGGEKVLEVLCELLPRADLYTLIHVPGSVSPVIEERRITASWLDGLPGARRHYRNLLPLMPLAAGSLRMRGYDLVVAISHCVAHGVRVEEGTPFLCYCNTPMRYAWGLLEEYFGPDRAWDPRYWAARAIGGPLRRWDLRASRRVSDYLANSRNIQERIRRCYGRDSAVVYPPVDTEFFRPLDKSRESFYLWVGAMAPYKRIDVAIEAFRRMPDRRLVVIGEGQDSARARRRAPGNVEFLGRRSDAAVREHYAAARALVFPGEEDFGIVPLEAQACGCPVIAYARGGALETVTDLDAPGPATGLLFGESSPQALIEAVERFERRGKEFDPGVLRRNAERFSRSICRNALAQAMARHGWRSDTSR
jgi:glycosyltransferase involved in cell wall biosynthesis